MGKTIEFLELTSVDSQLAIRSTECCHVDCLYRSDIITGEDFLKSIILDSIFVLADKEAVQIKINRDISDDIVKDQTYRFYFYHENKEIDWILIPTDKSEVKEVIKEVVKEVIKEVPVEVIKEVPVEKETIVEVPLINKNAYEEVEREPERTEEPVHRNHCIKSFSEKVFSDEYNYFTYPLMKITDREDKFKTVILNNNNSFSKVFEYALIPGVSKKYRIIIGDYMTKVEFDTISELKINYPDAYKKNLDQEYLYFYIPDEAARKLKINSNVSINLKGLENTLEAFEIKKKIYNL